MVSRCIAGHSKRRSIPSSIRAIDIAIDIDLEIAVQCMHFKCVANADHFKKHPPVFYSDLGPVEVT